MGEMARIGKTKTAMAATGTAPTAVAASRPTGSASAAAAVVVGCEVVEAEFSLGVIQGIGLRKCSQNLRNFSRTPARLVKRAVHPAGKSKANTSLRHLASLYQDRRGIRTQQPGGLLPRAAALGKEVVLGILVHEREQDSTMRTTT